MALIKCPKCELNYIKEGQKMCSVCAQNSKGGAYIDDADICPNCGEREVVPGEEFCAVCLAEFKKLAKETNNTKDTADAPAAIEEEPSADEITEMDDVDLDSDDEPPFDIEEEMNDEEESEESYDVLVMEENEYDEEEAEQ